MKPASKKGYDLSRRRAMAGRMFALPFYIGFVFFFLFPFGESIGFIFQNTTIGAEGYTKTFVGLENLKYIFYQDTYYTTNLVSSIGEILWQLPVILVVSLFFATIINQKFFGRTFVRAVFFLPVILASGIILNLISSDVAADQMLSGNAQGSAVSQTELLQNLFKQMGLGDSIIEFILGIVNSLFDIIWSTGIQTIIFLAGLQSVSSALYEAAQVEGASSWDSFWKITIPMLLPMVLVNTVYTVFDCFTSTNNKVMMQVLNTAEQLNYGWSSSMAWIYFIIICIFLALIFLLFRAFEGGSERKKNK